MRCGQSQKVRTTKVRPATDGRLAQLRSAAGVGAPTPSGRPTAVEREAMYLMTPSTNTAADVMESFTGETTSHGPNRVKPADSAAATEAWLSSWQRY
ncbi:hypothetical protein GCM10015535_37550 [Streptomyces gelaticus]|uniref:Uncharacterized protein n=1 Tax=Streptomyces gelaticus TaxID=285446 RepID=A0ABQ2W0P6_9ACTN|nr:hypothetical protein GCM10015535_37550 [Streptomyces gelaticus]